MDKTMLHEAFATPYPVFQESTLAKFQHTATLFFYDEPIHFLCRTEQGAPWVAMALDDDRVNHLSTYLIAPITEAQYQAHIDEGDLEKMVARTIHAMDREAHHLTFSWIEDRVVAEKRLTGPEARAFFPSAAKVPLKT